MITTKDKFGTFGKKRRTEGPPLDRPTRRYNAIWNDVWGPARRTLKEAQADETEMKKQAAQGVVTASTTTTVIDFIEGVFFPMAEAKVRGEQMKSTTVSHYRIQGRAYVEPSPIAQIELRNLRPKHLRDLYARLSKTLSPKSVSNVHVFLSTVLSLAVTDGYLPNNPAKVKDLKPKYTAPDLTSWTKDEVRTFFACIAEDQHFAAWRLYVMCGLRRGEALGLRWSDLDLDAGLLRVRQQLAIDPDTHALVFLPPKTVKSRRDIDLDSSTISALREHRKKQAAQRLAIAEHDLWPKKGDLAANLVFTDESGQPVNPNTMSRRFRSFVKSLPVTSIVLHETRHTAATLMLQAGVPLHVVSARLGHASIQTTIDMYGHVLREQHTDAAQRMGLAIDGV